MQHSKVIAILQPVYLPWLGYFEQMAVADLFVFMDDVQYTRKDWRNRNRIKTATGWIWLSVPVKKHPRSAQIRDVEINYQEDWRRRHLRSLEVSYRGCPGFEPLHRDLADVLATAPDRLLDLDCRLIQLLSSYLEITTPTSYSSEVPRTSEDGDRNGRILEICRHFGANLLFDGAKAAEFIDLERFRLEGIEVVFQDYQHPTHPQAFGEFISHLSALDLIMNTGNDAAQVFRSTLTTVARSTSNH